MVTVAGRSVTAVVACAVLMETVAHIVDQQEPFGLEEIVSGEFNRTPFPFSWIGDKTLVYGSNGSLYSLELGHSDKRLLIPKEILEKYPPESIQVSKDGRFALIGYDPFKMPRRTPLERYVVYKIDDGTTWSIGDGKRLPLALLGPGPGGRLAYVYRSDLFYLAQPAAEPLRVTADGKPENVFNGIFPPSMAPGGAMAWSWDGSKLAFGHYNDSRVRAEGFILYGRPGTMDRQYASEYYFPYSKAGSPGAVEKLKVARLPSGESAAVVLQELLPPVDVVGRYYQLEDIIWIDYDRLMASWTNRFSNVRQIVFYNTSLPTKQIAGLKGLKQEMVGGWLDGQLFFFRDRTPTYVTIAWESQGVAGGYPQVVAVTGNSSRALTSGRRSVTAIYGWACNGTVYYQATEEGQPSRRQVFAVEAGGAPRCLSCDVTSPEGRRCLRAQASFSHDLSWFLLTCQGPDPPFAMLRESAAPADTTQAVYNETAMQVVFNQTELRQKLASKQRPRQLDDWLEVGDGLRAQVRLLLPPGLEPRGSEKRPAVVHVYGGPGFQQVDDSFKVDISSYWTTSRRYVVILIDGRGSGCKGDRMLFSIYRRLGSVEVEDQINVTRQLTEKYSFIDASRVAIWGWSYGGYAAAMALARDEEGVFSCGVSVAPVASWIYYNSYFTDRFMGLPTPDDNEAGYNASDLTRLADRFRNKTFLLIHGTADDNVLYQNSMMLARALEEAGVLFRQQTYPDQSHSIRGLKQHVYRTIDEFLAECLAEQPPAPAPPLPGQSHRPTAHQNGAPSPNAVIASVIALFLCLLVIAYVVMHRVRRQHQNQHQLLLEDPA